MRKEVNLAISKEQELDRKEKGLKGLVAVAALAVGSSAFATTNTSWADDGDSFGELLSTFIIWLQGNLGKLLALLGFIGTFIIYLMTHKGSVLFIGVVISIIAGGLVGIVGTFWNVGASTFEINNS